MCEWPGVLCEQNALSFLYNVEFSEPYSKNSPKSHSFFTSVIIINQAKSAKKRVM